MTKNSPRFFYTFIILCLAYGIADKLFPQNISTESYNPRYIRNIEIHRQDVFPEITGRPRFLFQWANSLHIVTKESVIRKELLFNAGDVFDMELLDESERKLRRLAYFGDIKITVEKEEREFVDISVVTQDQWSTLLSTIIQHGGGRSVYGGAVEEYNLLGFGKEIYTELQHERSVGTQFSLRYTDPQLFATRWTTEERIVIGPLINSFSGRMVRPFYSLDTKWAGGASGTYFDATERIFQAGEEINRYQFQLDEIQLFAARALGSRFKKTRLQLTYRFAKRNFSTIEGSTTDINDIPEDELIHSTTARLSIENLSFVKEQQIDNFLRTEDLTLGNITSISFGRTGIPFPQGVKRFELAATRREAHQIFNEQYLFAFLGFQTLFQKNTLGSLRLQYYNKLLIRQTLAFNFEFNYGLDLEVTRPFLLGGDSGLRGFKAREFSGNKKILFNFEDRIFTSINILTVALGGVLFFDAGNVWPAGESINLRDLNYSIGLGLRLGYTKSPRSRVGRIDFAWPLSRGGGFGISIGVDQQFSIK